jgi:hypothetical protein
MTRHLEPTIVTTPGGEEVVILTLTKSEWKTLRSHLTPKQPGKKKPKLPEPVKLEGTLTTSDYIQAARD